MSFTFPTLEARRSSYMGWEDTMQFIHRLKSPILNVKGYDIRDMDNAKAEIDVSHFWDMQRRHTHLLTEMLAFCGVVDVFTVEY